MEDKMVTLAMGAGGRLSAELLETVILPVYGEEILKNLDDSAELRAGAERLAYTTDSYTVKPIFFPGGDIGKLSVCGTVNDLGMKGALPLALSAAFIIEDGFPIDALKEIVASMHRTARAVGVPIVTGDTKVVSRGEADGIFINTSGIGRILAGMHISSRNARVGDDIILSGSMGDHGISILNAREGLEFSPEIQSDVAPLSGVIRQISDFAPHIHVMRDPTRGGVASVLNEIAKASRVTIRIFEKDLVVRPEVARCCDLLGMDPLYIANEGKAIFFIDPRATPEVVRRLRAIPLAKEAAVIGRVEEGAYSDKTPPVSLETALGTMRFVPLIEGEPLPRIC